MRAATRIDFGWHGSGWLLSRLQTLTDAAVCNLEDEKTLIYLGLYSRLQTNRHIPLSIESSLNVPPFLAHALPMSVCLEPKSHAEKSRACGAFRLQHVLVCNLGPGFLYGRSTWHPPAYPYSAAYQTGSGYSQGPVWLAVLGEPQPGLIPGRLPRSQFWSRKAIQGHPYGLR